MIETIDAEKLFKTAIDLIKEDGEKEEIGRQLLKAFSLNNNLIGLNLALGDFFSNTLEIYKSYYFYKRELELHPYREKEITEHLNFMLAWSASYLGKAEEAIEYIQEAIKLNNNRYDYYNSLIYMANHTYEINDSELANIAKTFYENYLEKQFQIERKIIKTELSTKQYFKNTKIRIGILSSCFIAQSAEVLLLDILRNIDHSKYEFYSRIQGFKPIFYQCKK
jgi:tetratricopeptide (TPR) repeat protein